MSSFSCNIIMVIEMKNGSHYSGAFIGDAVCLPNSCIAFDHDLSLKESLKCITVQDLLNVLNNSYGGLISQFEGLNDFFDDDAEHIKANYVKHNGINAPLGGQMFMGSLLISDIKSVKLEEEFCADEGWGGGTLELDFIEKTELLTSNLSSDDSTSIYEVKRNLLSGEIIVLRDEEEYEEDEDWEEDE